MLRGGAVGVRVSIRGKKRSCGTYFNHKAQRRGSQNQWLRWSAELPVKEQKLRESRLPGKPPQKWIHKVAQIQPRTGNRKREAPREITLVKLRSATCAGLGYWGQGSAVDERKSQDLDRKILEKSVSERLKLYTYAFDNCFRQHSKSTLKVSRCQ